MGQIREEFVLCDKFTDTFTKYLRYGDQAAKATRRVTQVTEAFSQSQEDAAASTDLLTSKIKGLVSGYVGLRGIKELLDLSDTVTSTTARLDSMNDGLQTTAELNNMIWQSAQRARGSYQATADFVAQLGSMAGDAFSSSAEIVAFAEQINKQMVLSGASAQAAQAAMLQLTQGLASGTLRGDELNSVLEQTPIVAKTIAKYMGVTTGEMRDLASQGKVTADVVKAAMLGASAETDAAFEKMPMTWGQVWVSLQNVAIRVLQPVLNIISVLANHIDIIIPLVAGLAGAFVVFQVAANWTTIAAAATAAYHFVVNLLSIGFGVLSGSTSAASAAVMVFNSSLLASPITWIIMIILILIGVIYAVVAAVNHFQGTSISATGIIAGVFAVMGAWILNKTVIPLQNAFADFANFVGNLFNDPVAAVQMLFLGMAETVLGHIKTVAKGIEDLINKIPFVNVNLTSGIDALYNKVKDAQAEIKSNSDWKEYVKKMDYIDLADAASAGYNWGSNLFSGSGDPTGGGVGTTAIPTYDPSAGEQLGDIKNSVGSIEKSVNMTDEDIKSLVDMAERRYVNNVNLTAQTPVITVNGANTGRTAADRQALADAIAAILMEQSASGAVRSTARV